MLLSAPQPKRYQESVATPAHMLVIEHDKDGDEWTTDDKSTTVYWHISVNPDLGIVVPRKGCVDVVPPKPVEAGIAIGKIADIRPETPHLHFGMRMAPFHVDLSAKGALPEQSCGGWPGYEEYFVNPQDYLSK